ncbi:Pkinase-domain-containing protein [Clavulina sp. PMI_390]|nr:Pkinase-domain-containing protein [Clavulina sp. PMI_390]
MSSVIDDYEPLDIIGNGSFGVIRKVRRRSDGMLFARKELNFERMTDKDRKQIVAEVNILKDLKHENIVRYINRYVDHEARILYILMEYCGGGDLGAIIANARRQSRPLPEDQIWNYFVQMLLALHYCHVPGSRGQADVTAPVTDSSASSKQILHRDLKPENIFLSSDNEIKLGDFGLSKQIATAAFANTYVGTPYYMSPELISDKAYDTKSDIWSLGCMVYEMCALKAPFHDAQTYNELSAAIRSGRIPPLPKGYSSALSSIIKSMLNINPAMRPSTLQLLKIEQLMYAKKLIDVNKMIPEIRVKHEAIVAREKAASAREQTLVQREAELASQDAQLQADRGNLQSQKAAMDAEATQLAGHRAQLDADAALLEKARTEMAQARAEFDAQIIQAKQAYEVFTTQRDAFLEEKARWEQEGRLLYVIVSSVKLIACLL